MFACIYGQTVSKSQSLTKGEPFLDLAFSFSPLVELAAPNTVVLDIEGCDLLSGAYVGEGNVAGSNSEVAPARVIASAIARHAASLGLKVNIAIAANPDAAIHAVRSLNGVNVIPPGEELSHLGSLPLKMLDYSLAGIEEDRAEEIRETLALWGIRTFGDLAKLPLAGVAQRLGQEGVRLQKLAQGKSERHLVLVQSRPGFKQSIELEYPIAELEPLSFILARLLNQLCANLNAHALATNELRLWLRLEDKTEHERVITLPVPMRNSRVFLRLLLLDTEMHPPQSAVFAVKITAEPAKPRGLQNGLFIPLSPEPEKLELTLARLAKLVGAENVGSPELLDTHRPDAFRMKRFALEFHYRGHRGTLPIANCRLPIESKPNIVRDLQSAIRNPQFINRQSAIGNRQCVMGFRIFRPPLPAEVQTTYGQPVRIRAQELKSSRLISGKVICASGPWRTSGDWWRTDNWARDEWDIAIEMRSEKREGRCEPIDGNTISRAEGLYRIYRELRSDAWFVEGVYD